MEFKELIGKELDFYGVDFNEFKLGDTVYEALEDEGDGWRSYLGSIEVKDSDGIFFKHPLAKVVVEDDDDGYLLGYQLRDKEDGHIWLSFGTANYDDWYPYFTFQYNPKEKSTD
jgi:hypothetical protein